MDELTNFINHSYLFQDIFLGMDSCTNNVHLSSVCTCFTDVAYCHVFQRRPRDKSQLQIPNRGQRQYHSFTGHSPRGTVHIRILDPKQPVIVDFKLFYSTDKIVVVTVS